MSENLKGIIEIELKTDRFVQGGQKVRDETTRIDQATTKAGVSVGNMTQKVLAAGAAAGSTFFAFKGLQDMQLQIDKAARKVSEAEEKVAKALKDSGKQSDEYADSLRDLKLAQEGHKQAVDNVQQAQVQFAFSLASLAATTIPNAVKALASLFAGHGLAAGAAVGHTGATVALTRAQWGWNISLLANPFFAIPTAAAIAGAIALVATNQFGLRDSLFGVTEATKENTKAQKEAGNVYTTFPGQIAQTTNVVQEHTRAVKADTDVVKMWSEINKEALDDLKKNELALGSVNEFQQIAVAKIREATEKMRQLRRRIEAGLPTTEEGKTMRAEEARLRRLGVLEEREELANLEQEARFQAMTFGGLGVSTAQSLIEQGISKTLREASAQRFGRQQQVASVFRRAGQKPPRSSRAVGGSRLRKGGKRGARSITRRRHEQRELTLLARAAGYPEEEIDDLFEAANRAIPRGMGSNFRVPADFTRKFFERVISAFVAERERQRLAEIARVEGLAGRAGVTYQEIINIEKDPMRANDIAGLIAFRDRELLASTSV